MIARDVPHGCMFRVTENVGDEVRTYAYERYISRDGALAALPQYVGCLGLWTCQGDRMWARDRTPTHVHERQPVTLDGEKKNMDTDERMKPPSLWLPEPNLIIHQAVSKLGEEASELSKVCHRIVEQGVLGCDPDTQVANVVALSQEMDDVEALTALVSTELPREGTSLARSRARVQRKIAHKTAWMELLRRYRETRA